MEEITGQMGDYRTPKDSEITPFLHRKGNTLKGERLSVSAEAQALQNTPTVAQQEQQEDTQIQFQTLNEIRLFSTYPGYARNLYIFTGITKILDRPLSQQSTKNENSFSWRHHENI